MAVIRMRIAGTDYRLDTDELMASDVDMMETHTRYPDVEQLAAALAAKSFGAVRVMVWLMRRQEGERVLLPADVDFRIGDVESLDGDDPGPPADRPTGASPATSSGSPITSGSDPGNATA